MFEGARTSNRLRDGMKYTQRWVIIIHMAIMISFLVAGT